ncbi:Swm1p PWA37_000282 [Arxiozyma heterogenica]|uniref:Swm1p n=1 Tax=Arxiozyma heterogenica TaxID=278026 RepID=UPI002F06D8DA
MYQYRDSSYQYQHFTHSYYALYNEWRDDEDLPPPDNPLSSLNHNDISATSRTNSDTEISNTVTNANNNTTEIRPDQAAMFTSTNGDSLGTQYWEFFDDEENWEIFNKYNLQVESNGRIIYNHIIGKDMLDFNDSGTLINPNNNSDNAIHHDSSNPTDIIETNPTEIETSNHREDVNIISGSLFDPRILKKIRNKVNGWNDMGSCIR